MAKTKWKIGEIVRVTTAKEFIRCGYPMHLPEVAEDIETNRINEVNAAITAFGLNPNAVRGKAWRQLVGALAFAKISASRFGGPERKIYERDIDSSILGQTYSIIHKYGVMTGTYYPPSGGARSSMWDDDGWYEPGGLDKQTYNMILVLNSYGVDRHVYPEHVVREELLCLDGTSLKPGKIRERISRRDRLWEGYLHIRADYVEKLTDPAETEPQTADDGIPG